jgi:hypothetical protein
MESGYCGSHINMADFNFTYTRHTNYYVTGGISGDYRNIQVEASNEAVQAISKATTIVAVEVLRTIVKLAIMGRHNPYALPR